MVVAEPWLLKGMHPTEIISSFLRALDDSVAHLNTISKPVETNDRNQLFEIVKTCIGTKFIQRWEQKMCEIAVDAVKIVSFEQPGGGVDIDLKRFAKVERVSIPVLKFCLLCTQCY